MTDAPTGPASPKPLCARCGTPNDPEQEYCLECGLRLGGSPTLARRLESWWRGRFDSYPGDWIWPALLGLLIAVAGATGAILLGASNGGGGPVAATPSGTAHNPTTPQATETVALPTVPAGTPTATTTPPVPTTPPPATTRPPGAAPGSLTAWPARNGFTVVLESIPIGAGRTFAIARARAAARSGLPQVGIINSSRFSSLHPGYFVVFSGVYGSQSAADQGRITASAKGYPAAYAREIRR
jgi:hypothetical protein